MNLETSMNAATASSSQINEPNPPTRLAWISPTVILMVAFGLQRSVALLGLDLHHDSFMFDAARRTLGGDIPFRDFFYQYNLGTLFLHALALWALGAQIASLKIVTGGVYALIALTIYWCAAELGRPRQGFLLAMLWATLSPFYMPAMNGFHAWSTVYMMFSVMLGGLFLILALQRKTPFLYALAAGVCFNVSFWFKQVAGLQILFVLGWLLLRWIRAGRQNDQAGLYGKTLAGYVTGGLGSALPFFLYLFNHNLLADWWRAAFVFNGFFASSGDSASGIVGLMRTFFPVAGDMGYVSVIWAILPICLIGLLLSCRRDGRSSLSDRKVVFGLLGLAGWLEYFPLAHAFHTQLFMAPAFVFLTTWRWNGGVDSGTSEAKVGSFVLAMIMALFALAGVYESARHLVGFIHKVRQPTVTILGANPIRKLQLSPDNAKSFEAFYRAYLNAKDASGRRATSIPMSVDPLRAILPNSYAEPSDFKMGVDWTWPNELVEPGFNSHLDVAIATRKAPIYADALLNIPGYVPAALLEMPSPITRTHVLYVPSADKDVPDVPLSNLRDIRSLSSEAFPLAEQRSVTMGHGPRDLVLVALDDLAGLNLDGIAQLHVSIVRTSDFPVVLAARQYEDYLVQVSALHDGGKVAALFERSPDGRYELKWPLDKGATLQLAKFLMMHGKLFPDQNRPLFTTTLSVASNSWPFLVSLPDNEFESPRIAWSRTTGSQGLDTAALPARRFFLALPSGSLQTNEPALCFVQVVYGDGTARGVYVYYWPR